MLSWDYVGIMQSFLTDHQSAISGRSPVWGLQKGSPNSIYTNSNSNNNSDGSNSNNSSDSRNHSSNSTNTNKL